MLSSRSKATRWFEEVWRPGGEATVLELMAEDVVGQMEGSVISGREAFLEERSKMLNSFQAFSIKAEDIVTEGDKVVVRWSVQARSFSPSPDKPGIDVEFLGMTWMEFKDGLIIKGWDSWNLGGLIQKLTSGE